MPTLVDPATVLPDKQRRWSAKQIIIVLLYPVVLAVGLVAGLVIGIQQGEKNTAATMQTTQKVPTKIVPNANAVVTTNTSNANVGVSNVFLNTNGALVNGDYLKIDATTAAALDQAQTDEKSRLVDQKLPVTDIFRQQDVISIKYSLKSYFAVEKVYPTTNGQVIHLDRTATDVVYQALKTFYGGSFSQPIDPESPTYYYGYSSDGQTFTLTAYLTSKKQAFVLHDTP
ncbi:MAG: hypothetical protein HY092_01915 [Candidatus Kerfeldbacteria bacterium]|nr:hypothetical protein [Candidatus Kerfeldbacteria bacterium]